MNPPKSNLEPKPSVQPRVASAEGSLTRRQFLRRTSTALAAAWAGPIIVPGRVLGRDGGVAPPAEQLGPGLARAGGPGRRLVVLPGPLEDGLGGREDRGRAGLGVRGLHDLGKGPGERGVLVRRRRGRSVFLLLLRAFLLLLFRRERGGGVGGNGLERLSVSLGGSLVAFVFVVVVIASRSIIITILRFLLLVAAALVAKLVVGALSRDRCFDFFFFFEKVLAKVEWKRREKKN